MQIGLVPRDTSVAVGTTVVEISPETGTKQRQALVLTNTSTGGQSITIAWGKNAVAGQGVVLQPGEHHVEAVDASFSPQNLQITAVASAAGGTLAVHERLTHKRLDEMII